MEGTKRQVRRAGASVSPIGLLDVSYESIVMTSLPFHLLQIAKAQACVRVMLECTDSRSSARLQDPMRMQKFLDAVLMHCEMFPNNIAFVLKRLGASSTAGLQRLREISRSSKAIRVGQ